MDKERIRRIIAREGFIILGVLVASGILLWIHELIPSEGSESGYVYFCSAAGKKYTVELAGDAYSFADEQGYKIFTALRKKYPKDFLPGKDGGYRLPRDFKINYAKVKYSLSGQIRKAASNTSLFLLFIAYPFYLIFHFISWAIRLLIEE